MEYLACTAYDTSKENPHCLLRVAEDGLLEGYTFEDQNWKFSRLETSNRMGGNDLDHEPISEDEAEAIMKRWKEKAS